MLFRSLMETVSSTVAMTGANHGGVTKGKDKGGVQYNWSNYGTCVGETQVCDLMPPFMKEVI